MQKDIYALVDCNNFYASCERVFNPSLRNKPIGILSNNDGCIVAMSDEMKKLGIPRGKPAFKINNMVKKHKIEIFSSNYSLYGDMSARVMQTLAQFTPDLEIYSIDEAFLLLTGFQHKDLTTYGREISDTVYRWTGIPVSVGIGRTKTLAKIATHVAKKYKKFNNVFNIVDHPRKEKILETIPVENIWGVGRRYGKMLNKYGISNALELSRAPEKWIKKSMTIVGLKTVQELQGISCLDLEKDIIPHKQIISSRSFGTPVSTLAELQEATATYCTRAVEKLRAENLVASEILVYLTTNRFKNEPQYANYASASLAVHSAYTPDFLQETGKILARIYRPNYKYKKTGVMLSGIMHQKRAPRDLFSPAYFDDKRKDIMDKVDLINRRWGQNTVRFASSGIKQVWKMKREFLTPSYTTKWDDIPIVKA